MKPTVLFIYSLSKKLFNLLLTAPAEAVTLKTRLAALREPHNTFAKPEILQESVTCAAETKPRISNL